MWDDLLRWAQSGLGALMGYVRLILRPLNFKRGRKPSHNGTELEGTTLGTCAVSWFLLSALFRKPSRIFCEVMEVEG